SAQEEARPAGKDGHAAAGVDRVDPAPRVACKAAGAVALVEIDQVEAVMGNALPLGSRRLSRTDVHPAVHLAGIDRDDLAIQPLRDLDGDRGLAARRRAEYRDRPGLSHDGRSGAPAPAARDARSWDGRARRGTAGRSRTADRTAAPSPACSAAGPP